MRVSKAFIEYLAMRLNCPVSRIEQTSPVVLRAIHGALWDEVSMFDEHDPQLPAQLCARIRMLKSAIIDTFH